MQTLDWVVIGIFVLALVAVIRWVMRQKQDNAADYFLGGKDATWIAIGASILPLTSDQSTLSASPAQVRQAAWPWLTGRFRDG